MKKTRARKSREKKAALIVYDFDGVMTDNRVLVFSGGQEAVFCNRADGWAVARLKTQGYRQLILSTETNKVVRARARKLGLSVLNGVVDKRTVLLRFCKKEGIDLKDVVYIGNDLNDLQVMKDVGHPLCPRDADPAIKRIAARIIPVDGGHGVIRKFYHWVMGT